MSVVPASPDEEKEDDVSVRSITEDNLGQLRQINSIIFPIKYSPRFYVEIQKSVHEPFCKIVYVKGEPAGTICCRLELVNNEIKLYLMTMGILARFRDREVGTKALNHVLEAARDSQDPKVTSVYLHVQVSNEAAKRFYHRNGFVEVGLAKGYYKRIQPRDAWILECKLHSMPPDPDRNVTSVPEAASPASAPTPTRPQDEEMTPGPAAT